MTTTAFINRNWANLSLLAGLVASLLVSPHMPAIGTVLAQEKEPQILVLANPSPDNHEVVAFYITDDRQTIQAGDTATYRIIIRNQLPTTLQNVQIVQHIPDYLVPLATSPAAEPNTQARTLTWRNNTLPSNVDVVFSVQARVAPEASTGSSLRSTAEVHGHTLSGSATDQNIVIAASAPVPRTTPSPAPRAVHTTAQTGPASTSFLALSAFLGVGFLARIYKKMPRTSGI